MRRAGPLAVGVAMLTALSGAATARAATDGLFAPDSYRNKPLSASAPIDPVSSVYVSDLASKVRRLGVWVNTTKYSAPVYTVPAAQPTTRVAVSDPDLQQQLDDVPLPAGAQPAAGTDRALVVYRPSTGSFWEFWQFDPNGGSPRAAFGGRMDAVGTRPAYFTDGFGASASGIPLLAGLQRIDELRRGSIDHVVGLVVNRVGLGYRWPAQRSDGMNPLPSAVEEGMRFRFSPDLDIDALHLPRYAAMVARAVQRYGMVVTDSTGDRVGAAFYAEDPTPTGADPYHGPGGIFGGLQPGPDGQFRAFPWEQLELLR